MENCCFMNEKFIVKLKTIIIHFIRFHTILRLFCALHTSWILLCYIFHIIFIHMIIYFCPIEIGFEFGYSNTRNRLDEDYKQQGVLVAKVENEKHFWYLAIWKIDDQVRTINFFVHNLMNSFILKQMKSHHDALNSTMQQTSYISRWPRTI